MFTAYKILTFSLFFLILNTFIRIFFCLLYIYISCYIRRVSHFFESCFFMANRTNFHCRIYKFITNRTISKIHMWF